MMTYYAIQNYIDNKKQEYDENHLFPQAFVMDVYHDVLLILNDQCDEYFYEKHKVWLDNILKRALRQLNELKVTPQDSYVEVMRKISAVVNEYLDAVGEEVLAPMLQDMAENYRGGVEND